MAYMPQLSTKLVVQKISASSIIEFYNRKWWTPFIIIPTINYNYYLKNKQYKYIKIKLKIQMISNEDLKSSVVFSGVKDPI